MNNSIGKIVVDDMEVVTISNVKSPQKHIIFLHGGGYKFPLAKFHTDFGEELMKGIDATMYFPVLPLIPDNIFKDAYQKVLVLYNELLENVSSENITIMGDSSGGGIALGLCQFLVENNISQPKNIILISPWLDITLKNPAIEKLERLDQVLDRTWLKEMGSLWAGNQDLDCYQLSPINGKLEALGNLMMIVGSDEIFLPDTQRLRDRLIEMNVEFDYYEYKGMPHDFPLFQSPEAKEVSEIIKKKINTL